MKKLNLVHPAYLLAILVVGFFLWGQCQKNKVLKLEAENKESLHQEKVKVLENKAATAEANFKALERDRKKYTDSAKVQQRASKVRLRANLDTIASLKKKLAPRLQENPDINELVTAQDLAYSRLDSLYKATELAHSAEIVNLESQLKERGTQIMAEAGRAEVWRQAAEEEQKKVRKLERGKRFRNIVIGVLTAGIVYTSLKSAD